MESPHCNFFACLYAALSRDAIIEADSPEGLHSFNVVPILVVTGGATMRAFES